MTTEAAVSSTTADTPLTDKGVMGWMLYDWAAQPFYTLVTTFLFAPFFVNAFSSDPVSGQANWGYATAAAGLIVGLTSPVLGAWADVSGKRKPPVFVTSVLMIAGMCALWWAIPGQQEYYWLVVGGLVIAIVMAEYGIVLTNAMMSSLVAPGQLGRLSGYGWALGYAGGMVALIVMAGLVVTSPETGKTLLGLSPIIDFDVTTREAERAIGPFCALWFVLFAIPFFLFTPDLGHADPDGRTWRHGLAELGETLREIRSYREIVKFLVARMLYIDGLSAIFAFGGIYGASVFGWTAFQLGLFGIVLALAGTVGPIISGRIDDRINAKTVILFSLVVLMIASIGVVSITKEDVLFVFPYTPAAPDGPLFGSTGERVFIAFGILIGLAAGPAQASSRSLMARLAPQDKQSQFFGLFAFSGKVTSFLAPFAIALITSVSGSQRAGVTVILAFLIAGLAIMLTVRVPDRT